MAKKLTQISVEKAKADPTKRIEIPDAGQHGLYLVVQPSGVKSWAVRYRLHGKPKKFTLPLFVSLADAREKARDVLGKVLRGEDPSAAVPAKRIDLFKDVVSHFKENHLVPNKSKSFNIDFDRRMANDVLPTLGGLDIKSITKRDISDLLDAVTKRGGGVSVNIVHSMLRSVFNSAVDRGVIEISPMVGMKKRMETKSRSRVLSKEEIAALWRAADAVGSPAGPYVKMLLLTGQRRAEVAAMRWSEISKDGIWTIPGERSKNGKPNEVPLSGAVIELLKGVTRLGTRYVFTLTGDNPFTTNGKPKTKLDKAIGDAIGEPWVFHDLRRTCASHMQKLNISGDVIEAVLNHTMKGIRAVYQRDDFADQKRAALEAWARYVVGLVQPVEKNVVPLRRA
jgi:integrase